MPYLGNPPAERFTSLSKQTITGDGGTAYTLDFPVGSNQDVEVFVNNVRQEPGVAYTVSGTSLTMTGAVQSSDDFYVVFQGKAIGTVTHPAGNALEATSGAFTGNVGIGTSSPTAALDVRRVDADGKIAEFHQSTGYGFTLSSSQAVASIESGYLQDFVFKTGSTATERMRIDSSGNLLVGKTSSSIDTEGVDLRADGQNYFVRDGGTSIFVNRLTSDGELVSFRKDGSTVGSIGCDSGAYIYIGSDSVQQTYIGFNNNYVYPSNNAGGFKDNAIDLGNGSARYDDIYATNGTIQTSDRNEKQDIEALTDAEQRVAVAAKGLMRKFRWKDRVAEKGDDARIHFGIIAQDLQAAFEAEGLDAGRYAMFIHSEWWETTETYTDDDGVEQTRINTYDSEDEAPEGAVKKSRMGVRYSELLAFIIAAI